MSYTLKTPVTKPCGRCGEVFTTTRGARQIYCSPCVEPAKRETIVLGMKLLYYMRDKHPKHLRMILKVIREEGYTGKISA